MMMKITLRDNCIMGKVSVRLWTTQSVRLMMILVMMMLVPLALALPLEDSLTEDLSLDMKVEESRQGLGRQLRFKSGLQRPILNRPLLSSGPRRPVPQLDRRMLQNGPRLPSILAPRRPNRGPRPPRLPGLPAPRPTSIDTAESTFRFREWESKRTEAANGDSLEIPPTAFRPSEVNGDGTPYYPYFPEFPEVSDTLPEQIKRGIIPQAQRPPWLPTPHPEEPYIRSSPEESAQSGNNRVSLQTEYFSLPAIRDSEPSITLPSISGSNRARIPVLVKKLAKRPVKKSTSTTGSITIVDPRLVNTSSSATDLCKTADIECVNNNDTDGSSFNSSSKSAILLNFIRTEIWVVPVIVSAGALLALLLIFEIYLISKAVTANPSRRHLFLGQMLMLGLMSCCAIAVVLALKPTVTGCAVARIGLGLTYTLIYSTLLVKLVFLISLNSGVYLPATYQCLLLCFAILIQLVISIQWLMSTPAEITEIVISNSTEVYATCNVTFKQQILGLLYVIFLVLVVVILAFKSRGVRENYREAMYIGLTMFFTVCIFTIWILAGFIAPAWYSDMCLACGLLGCGAISFIIMFMPKGRQLSAMGKEGVYMEDRNDVYTGSSTQSTASGGTPSPSFFPIRPGKLVHQFRDRLDSPITSRKIASTASLFPPPPPPPLPPVTASDLTRRRQRRSTSHTRDFHHHHQPSHHHHHHHLHSDHSTEESRDSMANLVGTDDLLGGHSVFHPRWRSRSSPAVAHRFLGDFHHHHPRDRSPPPAPLPRNFHSSFHDLHAANELRASRHDLREMRDLLRQNQTVGDLTRDRTLRSSRRSLHERKWPPPRPASPGCRRCEADVGRPIRY